MKTKIYKRHTNHKKFIITCAIVVVVVGVFGCLYLKLNDENGSTNDTKQTTQTKNNSKPSSPSQTNTSPTDKPSDSPTSSDISVIISGINISSDTVQIRSVINGVITNSGQCTLTLTSESGNVVTKTSDTYALPASSTCMGFDINKSELQSSKWHVLLSVKISGKTSTITDDFTIE
jgi:hypothetical protein